MRLGFPAWCRTCPLKMAVFASITLFRFHEPVFDVIRVLTSWTMFHGILYRSASLFLIKIQDLVVSCQ